MITKTREEQLAERAAYMREWSRKHPHIKTQKKGRIAVRLVAIQAMKEAAPCTDCGLFYPHWIMQYDHLRDKYKAIAHLCRGGSSMDQILKEIEKCELVCANCHCTRTHKRRYKLEV